MKYTIFLLLLSICHQFTWSQNYQLIDEKVYGYPVFNNIETLSIRIQNDFKTDIERTRAVFIWMAKNLEYDINTSLKPKVKTTFFYSSQRNLKNQIREYQENLATVAFSSRKALCEGFSLLFVELCHYVGLEAIQINGVTKISATEIDVFRTVKDHAWNAVKIQNQWKLIDVTWSAGSRNLETGVWQKDVDDYFFMTPPQQFLTSHYPEHKIWQLIKEPITLSEFFEKPVFYKDYFKNELILSQNQKGVIEVSNNKIIVEFDKKDKNHDLYYTFSNDRYSKLLYLKKTKEKKYQAILDYDGAPSNTLTLYLNNNPIIDFKIIALK